MKMSRYVIVWILTILIIQCKEDEQIIITFNPTDHPISVLGDHMRLSIEVPIHAYYNFSADTSRLSCSGNNCYDYLATVNEMEILAMNLSDTTYFPWHMMTQVSPYPATDCKLLLYGGDQSGRLDYMCTIGNGEDAGRVVQELSRSFTDDARKALEDIANLLFYD